MVKNKLYSFIKMNKDIVEGKNPEGMYFDAKNMRFLTNKEVTSGGFEFERGNLKIGNIPSPVINSVLNRIEYTTLTGLQFVEYAVGEGTQPRCEIESQYFINVDEYKLSGEQIVIGYGITKDVVIVFSTDNNGFDCIWKIDNNNQLTLIYMRDINLSTNSLIQTVNNFENEKIDKIYWVDGVNQLRSININHSIANGDIEELIDVPTAAIDMIGFLRLNQPVITEIVDGGTNTAGMVQYAYNLYRLNGAQSSPSPLSELISLDKDLLGGGDLNEVIGKIPVVTISNIDENYTHIKVYSVKYTTLGGAPSINLIDEREIPPTKELSVFDDGSVINQISLEEFIFLGSSVIIPKHAQTKYNRMFLANYVEKDFEVDLDMRAYSHDNTGEAVVYENISAGPGDTIIGDALVVPLDWSVPEKHDATNIDPDTYKYWKDGTTFGGEGKYIKYELTQNGIINSSARYFKDNEIYRIAIQFYNKYGQISLPIWIADLKSLEGNLEGLFNTLEVTLKPEFYTWLNTSSNFEDEYDKPVGYRVLVAERTFRDKTIVAGGFLTTMIYNEKTNNPDYSNSNQRKVAKRIHKMPTFFVRNLSSSASVDDNNCRPVNNPRHLNGIAESNDYTSEVYRDSGSIVSSGKHVAATAQFTSMMQMYSPEILFGEQFSLTAGLKLRIKGAFSNSYNAFWGKEYNNGEQKVTTEGKCKFGISVHYSTGRENIIGNSSNLQDNGLIAHPGGHSSDVMAIDQYYRAYGDIPKEDGALETLGQVEFTQPFIGSDVHDIVSFIDPRTVQVLQNLGSNSSPWFNAKTTFYVVVTPDVGYTTVPYDIIGDYGMIQTGVTGTIATNTTLDYPTNETNVIPALFGLYVKADADFNCSIRLEVLYEEFVGGNTASFSVARTSDPNPHVFDIDNSGIFNGVYQKSINEVIEDIYGTPELTERGQNYKSYNGDIVYKYINSFQNFVTDGDDSWENGGPYGRSIVSVNSYNNRCITLVTGSDDPFQEHWERKGLEQLFLDSGITGKNWGLIGELVKSKQEIFLGNIYGGNTWEDKKRTNYLEVGPYSDIEDDVLFIESPGDTFVGNFRFERVTPTDVEQTRDGFQQLTEILEYPTETVIDLKNRNDLSRQNWDQTFQPKYQLYHKYNKVYSQGSNLNKRRDLSFTFKKVRNFETNIIATKQKVAGETIDSWTDLQRNNVMTLDGKFGPITGIPSLINEIYCFQEKAISRVSINPRVQVQGSDGIAVELGTGQVLDRYDYLTVSSGSINKWGIMPTQFGIFYIDALNRTFNIINGGSIEQLSDKEGMHKYFNDLINLDSIRMDNFVTGNGVSFGWDQRTHDIYFSIKNSEDETKNRTIAYNMQQQGFSSEYDYNSSFYMFYKGRMLTINPGKQNEIYENFIGEYNVFYEENRKSSVTFIVNPEPLSECTFNNLEYKSEAFNGEVEVGDYTWERIRINNEFQDSGFRDLDSSGRGNIRKLNRKWRLNIPRHNDRVSRIRNTWSYVTLESDNQDKYRYRNNDILLYYNLNSKSIQ